MAGVDLPSGSPRVGNETFAPDQDACAALTAVVEAHGGAAFAASCSRTVP